MSEQTHKPTILVAGPYITNYSFAKTNRGLAVALNAVQTKYNIKLWKNPNFRLDKDPTEQDLDKYPEMARLLSNEVDDVDILLYCGFPSDAGEDYGFASMPGKLKLMHLVWEETVYPEFRVKEINNNLHGLVLGTKFVENIMQHNGIQVPMSVVGVGINDNQELTPNPPYPLKTKKSFKFFHNSVGKVRKGIDVLLEAYFSEFTDQDNVVLVIKSFPSPENRINEILAELSTRYPHAPEVEHILNPNLTEQEIADITATCDCAVYPTRTEGFGMTLAEAMYFGVPVIATGYSGHLDFANDDNAFLIDYELVDATSSEAVNLGAKWAEPSLEDLRKTMRWIFDNQDSPIIKEKVTKAKAAAQNLTWENVAQNTVDFIDQITGANKLKHQKLGVISTYNTISGIAEHTKYLYEPIAHSFAQTFFIANSDVADLVTPDAKNVVRLWQQNGSFEQVAQFILENALDIVHVQYHPGEMSISELLNMSHELKANNSEIKFYLTVHSLFLGGNELNADWEELKSWEKIIVHKQADKDYLAGKGLTNVALMPIAYEYFPIRNKLKLKQKLGIDQYSPVIISHGLLSSHKGLLETAEAIASLKSDFPNILWIAANALNINNMTSVETHEKLMNQISDLNITENVCVVTDFLPADQIKLLLQAADIGILAYTEVGESASAAVRKMIASGVATIVTDIPMMTELNEEVLKIASNNYNLITAAISELWKDKEKYEQITTAALHKSEQLSWGNMGIKLLHLYSE